MTFNEAREKISQAIYDLHVANYPGVPIIMPNKKGLDIENEAGPFVQVEIHFDVSRQLELGGPRTISAGRVVVSHHVREEDGTRDSLLYSDFLVDNIGLKTIDSVEYRAVAPTGQDLSIGWYSVFNSIPFQIFNIF